MAGVGWQAVVGQIGAHENIIAMRLGEQPCERIDPQIATVSKRSMRARLSAPLGLMLTRAGTVRRTRTTLSFIAPCAPMWSAGVLRRFLLLVVCVLIAQRVFFLDAKEI